MELTAIVKRAMVETVTNIGQLSDAEVRQLNKAVRAGYLSKGKGGPFPVLKTVWAVPGFDFAADRQASIDELMAWHAIDVAQGTAKFFPMVKFQKVA